MRCIRQIFIRGIVVALSVAAALPAARAQDPVVVRNVRFEVTEQMITLWYDLHHKDESSQGDLGDLIASFSNRPKGRTGDRQADPRDSAVPVTDRKAGESVRQEPPSEQIHVTVILRKEGDDLYRYLPRQVSGDVGNGQVPGKDKKVVWEVFREFPHGLEGVDYFFEVRAELVGRPSISWLHWLAGGAAVIGGGVATYLLLTGNDNTDRTNQDFPPPPGRPQ